MDLVTVWFVLVGVLFIGLALSGSVVARLPLTTSMLYLAVGILLGPSVSGLLRADPIAHSTPLERMSEVAVVVSLFTAGLKLRVPLSDRRWMIAVRLAVVSMAITVALVASAAVILLGLPWGVGSSWERSWRRPTPCSRQTFRWNTPSTTTAFVSGSPARRA